VISLGICHLGWNPPPPACSLQCSTPHLQLQYQHHLLHSLCTLCSTFKWPGDTEHVRSVSVSQGQTLPTHQFLPPDLQSPQWPLPSCSTGPTTDSVNSFDTRSILSALHSIFCLAGEYPHLALISCCWPATTITTASTSFYRSHHAPYQPFQSQSNTECRALDFQFDRGIPPPHVDLLLPVYHHHNYHIKLILQVPTTLPTSGFKARAILSAGRSIFSLTGEYPCLALISCSWPTTTITTTSSSSYGSPPCSPPTVSKPEQYWV